jgi:hypothetical protein
VVGVRIAALPARVRATQLDILRPAGPAPDRLAATLARLAALVGPENVGAPAAVDSWREEAAAVASFAGAAPAAATTDEPRAPKPCLTICRFRPPEEVEVLMGRDGPTALRGNQTTARVLVAAGPYHVDGEWWRGNDQARDPERVPPPPRWARAGEAGAPPRDTSFARAYWDVHASDGAVYRLHQDRRSGRWYLDGYYD